MKIDPAQARQRPTGLDPDIPRLLIAWAGQKRLSRPPGLAATAFVVSLAAAVLWIISLQGTWEVGDQGGRSREWAVEGSLALAGLAIGRLRRSTTWRRTVAAYTFLGGAVMAIAIWVHASGVPFPLGASALGFLAMVGVALAAALWAASDVLRPCPRRWALVVTVVAGVVIAGCAGTTSGWSDRSLASHPTSSPLPAGPTPVDPTTRAWTRTLPGPNAQVVSDDSQVYVSSTSDATVTAIDPRTGHTRWTWHRPSADPANIGVGSGMVAAEIDGRISVLDARTGTERFVIAASRTSLDDRLHADQLTLTDGILVRQEPGTTTAWSLHDGRILGSMSVPEGERPVTLDDSVTPPVAAAGGRVGVLLPDGTLQFLGSPLPRAITLGLPSGDAFQVSDLDLLSAGGVLVGSAVSVNESIGQGLLTEFAVDPGTGRLLWHRQVPLAELELQQVAPAPGGVLAVAVGGQAAIVDPRTGRTIRPVPAAPFASLDPLVSHGSTAFVQSDDVDPLSWQGIDLLTGRVAAEPAAFTGNTVFALPGRVVVAGVADESLSGYR